MTKKSNMNSISSSNVTGLLLLQGKELEDDASLIYVEQTMMQLGLCQTLIQLACLMVAVAAMIYKKDHAPTDPSQQPLISDSTETNHNLLAPPIPTNPLHLAAAAALMLPPFPNMETVE